MADPVSTAAVAEFLYREARLLDARKLGDWLDLYCDDAVFWVPAVTMAGAHTTDPETSLNFIYIAGRAALEARVFRVESGGSLASNPLPRTRHLVTGVMIDSDGPSEVRPSPTPRSWRSARRAASRSSMAPTSTCCARTTVGFGSRRRRFCCSNTSSTAISISSRSDGAQRREKLVQRFLCSSSAAGRSGWRSPAILAGAAWLACSSSRPTAQ